MTAPYSLLITWNAVGRRLTRVEGTFSLVYLVFNTITNPQSVVSRALRNCETPEEKIETIYLSTLGRSPEPGETEIILADREARGDDLYQDVIYALMNTQEFFFVR